MADEPHAVAVPSARVGKPVAAIGTVVDRPASDPVSSDRLLRLPEVERRTGLSKSTIYRRIGGGRFPASVPMTGNIALWRESDVVRWIADPI